MGTVPSDTMRTGRVRRWPAFVSVAAVERTFSSKTIYDESQFSSHFQPSSLILSGNPLEFIAPRELLLIDSGTWLIPIVSRLVSGVKLSRME